MPIIGIGTDIVEISRIADMTETTRDRLAKSNRRQIAQWPIIGPWCTLWHRFNSHLGADLRAGGMAMGRDSMCRDGCAPPSGGRRQNIDHHPAQRARLKQEPSRHHAGPQVRLR